MAAERTSKRRRTVSVVGSAPVGRRPASLGVDGSSALALAAPLVAPGALPAQRVARPRRHLTLVSGGAGAPQRVVLESWADSHPFPVPVGPERPRRSVRRLGRLVRAAVVLGALVWGVLGLAQLANPAVPTVNPAVQIATSSSLAWASADVVVVGQGQTLWQIAGEVAPEQDRRDTVEQIKELNGLSTSLLTPGQHLRVR